MTSKIFWKTELNYLTYQTVWGRRATSFGAQEERKYSSLFKVRPDYILPSLFISITACGTAVHCPMNSQAAMRLLHDETGLIQWTVLMGTRNCVNVQALYYLSITRAMFRRHSTSPQHSSSWSIHLLYSDYCEQLHLLLWLLTISQNYTVEDFLLKEVTGTADMRVDSPLLWDSKPSVQVHI